MQCRLSSSGGHGKLGFQDAGVSVLHENRKRYESRQEKLNRMPAAPLPLALL